MARGRFEAIDGGAIFIGVLLLEVSAVVTLNIRNLPDEVQAALRVRAAKAVRSMDSSRGWDSSAGDAQTGRRSPGLRKRRCPSSGSAP